MAAKTARCDRLMRLQSVRSIPRSSGRGKCPILKKFHRPMVSRSEPSGNCGSYVYRAAARRRRMVAPTSQTRLSVYAYADVSDPRRQSEFPDAIRDVRNHRAERARVGGAPRIRHGADALRLSLPPWADSRRAAADGSRRRARSDRAERGLRAQRFGLVAHADHVDVHARRLVAHHRQHVVPVDLRQQRRGCDGACAFRRVLSALRPRGRGRADCSRIRHPSSRWSALRARSAA